MVDGFEDSDISTVQSDLVAFPMSASVVNWWHVYIITDEDVGVPIVPLTEENETAMEDKVFLSFLVKIGLAPPANEQVLF